MKVAFTAKRVSELECETGRSQSIHKDLTQPGLGLRVTPAGERAYIHEQKLNSRTIRITIGSPAAWPLEKARTESARLRVLIDSGKDPREERRQQAADHDARQTEAARSTATLAEAWTVYIESNRGRWSPRYYSDHVALSAAGGEDKKRGEGKTMAGPLAALMRMRLADLTPDTIKTWLVREAATRPEVVRMAFNRLKIFATWTESRPEYRKLIDTDAVDNRLAKAALPKQKPKTDCLQREQLPAFFAAARQLDNPVMSTYLIGLLLTGARREELAGLTWANVDFKWRSLRIADKVDGSRVIPLTPFFASLLLKLKTINDTPPNVRQLREQFGNSIENWKPSEFVFASTGSSGRLTSPNRALDRVCAAASIPHVSLHGLRRSFGTLSEWCDLPTGVVAQIQGHKPSAVVEKHYRRRPLDMLRQHHDRLEQWFLTEAKVDFTPAVAEPTPPALALAV